MRNMIDKVLRNPFKSFCLLTGLAGRKCNPDVIGIPFVDAAERHRNR